LNSYEIPHAVRGWGAQGELGRYPNSTGLF
jgi:hypothetical protein